MREGTDLDWYQNENKDLIFTSTLNLIDWVIYFANYMYGSCK